MPGDDPDPVDVEDFDRLKVILVSSADVDAAPSSAPVRRPALPGLEAPLVVERGDGPVPVTVAEAESLGELDDLWEEALARTGEEDVPEIDVEEVADGIPVMVLFGESPYNATNAMWPERFLEVPEDGLLLAVPHRHVVWVHPIRDEGVVTALARLLLATRSRFDDAAEYRMTPQLYWWHDGGCAVIDAVENEDAVGETAELMLALPEGFEEVFARHMPDQGG